MSDTNNFAPSESGFQWKFSTMYIIHSSRSSNSSRVSIVA